MYPQQFIHLARKQYLTPKVASLQKKVRKYKAFIHLKNLAETVQGSHQGSENNRFGVTAKCTEDPRYNDSVYNKDFAVKSNLLL